MYKVPSPFNSPVAKVFLAIFWCAYAGMLVGLIVNFDFNLLIVAGWWMFVLPWITWSFLSGVQVEPGKRVGGGPMYPRVALEPAEVVVFNAPIFTFPSGGHVFITDRRIILLPIRFYGGARRIALGDVTSVETEKKGFGWPLPKESVVIECDGQTLELRPWVGPRLAGLMPAEAFVAGLMDALDGRAAAPTLGRRS